MKALVSFHWLGTFKQLSPEVRASPLERPKWGYHLLCLSSALILLGHDGILITALMSQVRWCISYLSHCHDKINTWQKQCPEGRFLRAHGLKVLSIMTIKAWPQEHEATGHNEFMLRKQRGTSVGAGIIFHLLCSLGPQPKDSAATFIVSLPSLAKSGNHWRHTRKCFQTQSPRQWIWTVIVCLWNSSKL